MGKDDASVFDRPAAGAATPIPTMHEGVVFRSRLEARWAVFFETLGIRALYEHEGFEFHDGTRYLPDFWLPKLGAFVEIKPTKPTAEELRKCRALAVETKHRVLLLVGAPGDWLDGDGGRHSVRFWEDGTEDDNYLPCECKGCGKVDWQYDGYVDRLACDCPKSTHGKDRRADSERIVRAAQLANAVNLGVR